MAIDVSEGLHASAVAPAIVYALKFIYEVGSEMLFDVAIQLVMEKFTTGVSWGTAWNNLEVDQASVKSAFVSGSLSFVASFFGAAKSNTGQVTIAGLSEAVSYLLGFSGGAQGGMTTRSSGFSLTTFCEKFIQGRNKRLLELSQVRFLNMLINSDHHFKKRMLKISFRIWKSKRVVLKLYNILRINLKI
jgi:hypothetical protein